jgi:hypothetical protein
MIFKVQTLIKIYTQVLNGQNFVGTFNSVQFINFVRIVLTRDVIVNENPMVRLHAQPIHGLEEFRWL